MTRKILVWDLPVRIFHWGLAGAFIGAYVLSDSERWRLVHVTLGYTVLALVAFRLVWGFVGTRYARFRSFSYGPAAAVGYLKALLRRQPPEYVGHNPAASWAIYGMLGLALATGITGWLHYNELGGEVFEEIHEVFANAWLALVLIHVAGVIASSVAHRENLPRAMLTGFKSGAAAPDAEGNRGSVAALLVAMVAGIWMMTIAAAPGGSLRGNTAADAHDDGAVRIADPGVNDDDDNDSEHEGHD